MLGTRTIMALQAVLYIAEHGHSTPVPSKAIVEHFAMSPRYFEPLLQQLATAGIITATRGPKGGYQLAKDKSKITLLDVDTAITEANSVPKNLHKDYVQSFMPHLQALQQSQQDYLRTISLLELQQSAQGTENNHFAI